MKWNEGPKFENPSPGNYLGRCIQIIDLGTQEHRNPTNGETWGQRDVRIAWELPTELMQGIYKPEVKGRPFAVGGTYKQSLHDAAKLRKLLVSWRGRDFTDDEIKAFNPRNLLGLPCSLSLVEKEGYINVHAVSGVMRGMQVPPQINPSIFLSLEEDEFDETVFFGLPDKTREKIAASPEFGKLVSTRPHLMQGVPTPTGQFTPDPRQTPAPQAVRQAMNTAQSNMAPVPRPPTVAAYVHPHANSVAAPVEDAPWPTDGQI